MIRAVAKLKIEWPAGKEHQEHAKCKLDERVLCLKSLLPHRGFFPIPITHQASSDFFSFGG